MPSTSSSLSGWGRLEPGRSRPPIPFLIAQALARRQIDTGHILMGILTMLLFESYARISEALGLRAYQVVEPTAGTKIGVAQFVGILLAPQEEEEVTKTGAQDVSIMLDLPKHAPLAKALLARRELLEDREMMFPFTYDEYRRSFMKSAAHLNLECIHPTIHGLRHGGASNDRALGLRTAMTAQPRGE